MVASDPGSNGRRVIGRASISRTFGKELSRSFTGTSYDEELPTELDDEDEDDPLHAFAAASMGDALT